MSQIDFEELKVRFEDVKLSYNGKVGCMCGCRGRYSLPSHVDFDEAGKERGYPYDPEDVSDRRVKLAVNKINKALIEDPVNVHIDDEFMSFEHGDRLTVVYFKETVS